MVGLKGGWHSGLVMSGLTHQHAVRLAQVPELALRLRGGAGEGGHSKDRCLPHHERAWMSTQLDWRLSVAVYKHSCSTCQNVHTHLSNSRACRQPRHVVLAAGHRGSQKGVSYMQLDGEPWKQAIPTKDGEYFTVGRLLRCAA